MKEQDMQMPDYESFFAGERDHEPQGDHLEMIPLSRLKNFSRHTFDVEENEELAEIVESIKMIGQVEPIVVRTAGRNNYEIISGHRRTYACMLAGLTEVEAVVRDKERIQTEAHATISMTDANMKRTPKPSELARTYKAKQEAVKQLPGNTGEQVAFGTQKSRATIYRYMRLAELVPELLKKIDQKRINLAAGGILSDMSMEHQMTLNTYMEEHPKTKISPAKASELVNLSDEEFTEEEIEKIINPLKAQKQRKSPYEFPPEIKDLFPKETSYEQMRERIVEALSQNETKVQKDGSPDIPENSQGARMI
jgi:ParB family chromosome partitioning protein